MTEKAEAKRDGARLQKNSGRGEFQKGDATTDLFVVDYKETNKTFGLSQRVWAKICSDAAKVDVMKYPVLKVIMGEGNNKTRVGVVPWDLLQDMERVYMLYLEES